MVTMWICFLAAVVVGAFYQYLAVKYLEGRLTGIFTEGAAWAEAGTVWDMLGAFYGGAIRAGQAMISLTQLSDRGGEQTLTFFVDRS